MSRILLYEPFFKGSHKYFAQKLAQLSQHEITLETQNGVFWKWKLMQSAVIGELSEDHQFDYILTTNMVNLASWAGINRARLKQAKLVHYFHENQLCYPGVKDQAQNIYAFVDFTSAVAADKILFNSQYQLESFLKEIALFSQKLPQKLPAHLIDNIQMKSAVLPVGIEVERLLQSRINPHNDIPIILWNHRHEWDKNPETFFEVLFSIKEKNIPFQLVVLGSAGENPPKIFAQAKKNLQNEILHWGKVDSFEEYAQWLWRSDILPVTSHHDFFGISVLEAALCHNHLLLPMENAYPEHFVKNLFKENYYTDSNELRAKLITLLTSKQFTTDRTSQIPLQYSWELIIPKFDQFFAHFS